MGSESVAILCGLGCAVVWGASDFTGGLATRKSRALPVILFSQLIGLSFLLALALIREPVPPPAIHLLTGALGGLCGAGGIVCLYKGLASGRMGIVAPVSAVVTAMVPVVCASLAQGLPPALQAAGFGLALASMWLLSWSREAGGIELRSLILPMGAGFGFGLFFVFISYASAQALWWPLAAAKLGGFAVILLAAAANGQMRLPPRSLAPLILAAGLFDAAGNGFYAMAAQAGRMDVAAVLASLYPASTVLLAWWVLKERLHWNQWAGLAITLAALVMISAG